MTYPREQRIAEIVEAARLCEANRRAALLDEACGDDAALRDEVRRRVDRRVLVEVGTDVDKIGTDAPTQPAAEEAKPAIPPALRISSYKILDVLGEGGMGMVYRAEQENPHRVVALKLLKAGGASQRALKRFEHEAQVLGRLQHPGIAQIFEAGTADTGYGPQPFFVMELIEGVPLKAYADSRELSLRERLTLLVKVCDGVQHAHQKGIIHRDLKPGNILVDQNGQPKILDFGIALATDSDIQASTSPTFAQQLAGTVPYMSFEQVKGDPGEIDTRTDVYALGVIAFQLLCGSLPYDLENKTIPEAVRIIGEEEPRQLVAVDPAFRGDVATIVGKALERDKTRRYQSASDLAADIQRFLSDEPILARPPTAAYQFRKFAKRNRALVGGVLGIFVMLVAAIVGTGVGFRRAVQAREKLTAINSFLDEMLASAELDKDATVRQALDEAAGKIEEGSLAYEPQVEAAVRVTLGKTYRSLGFYETAERHLTLAMAANRRALGDEHSQTLVSMNELALLFKTQGRLSEAEPLYLRTLDARRRILGAEHPQTLETRHNLASLLEAQGDLARAELLYRDTLEAKRRVLGDEHEDTLVSMNNLALVLKAQDRLAEAEHLYRRTLEAQRRTIGAEHPHTLMSQNNLAMLLSAQDKDAEAAMYYRRTLEARRRKLGEDHPDTVTSMHNLALVLKEQGELSEAEELYRGALQFLRRKLGDGHHKTITSMTSLALLLEERHDYNEAVALHREVLRLRRETLPEGHPQIASALIRLGMALVSSGDAREAEPLLRECLSIRRQTLPEGDWSTANAENALGACLTSLGRFDEAEPLLLESYPLIEAKWGKSDERTQRALNRIVKLYDAWGKPDKAALYR